jgi:uncharacterized protein (DUF58 family)
MPVHLAELHNRAELLAANLPPLMVAAERVAATVAQGVHGRRRVGQGETFWQFRSYERGDPIQHIDWRRSGRSDGVYLRETEWEAAQSVWLWSDASPSMQYQSNKKLPTKVEHGDLITLALASLLVRGGEHIAPLGRGTIPSSGKMALNLLAAAMEDREIENANLKRSGHGSLPPFEEVPKHGRVVLVSDFLEPLDEINRAVGLFSDRGVDGYILQILDPAEQSLPFGGRTRFEGTEDEGNALIGRVEGVRDDYKSEMAAQRRGLEAIARTAGWGFGVHTTGQPPEATLMKLFVALTATIEWGGAH